MPLLRASGAALALLAFASSARAGTLVGKLDLPPAPDRPPVTQRGFLDRVENPLAPVRKVDVTGDMVIVLEGDDKPVSPPMVTWELVGDSFAHHVVAAPAGAQVVIKNVSRTARTLIANEDPKLIPEGPINPTGPKSFRVTDVGKVYTIGDPDAAYLHGTLVVVNTQYIAYPDDSGHFEIHDVPAGNYKLRIWYRTGWVERSDDAVTVGAKGKTTVNPKVPAGAFASPAAKK